MFPELQGRKPAGMRMAGLAASQITGKMALGWLRRQQREDLVGLDQVWSDCVACQLT